MQTLKAAETHLRRATCERSYYRAVVQDCKIAVCAQYVTGSPTPVFSPPPPGAAIPSGSGPACMHYSFDFAQQVHYPPNPLQPGPMFFKTARKCGIFGVCCEGILRQVNYLVDEALDTGKGANTVVRLLHHFLATYSLGAVKLQLHADNCSGQNKNNTAFQVHILSKCI